MDLAVFEWLTKCLEKMLLELEELIEKKNTPMCERNLPWTRIPTSADHARFARGMMNDPKWTIKKKWSVLRKESSDRINLRDFDHLIDTHRRKNSTKCLREHSFSASWWSLQDDIMSTCTRDQKRALRMFLSENRGEIDDVIRMFFTHRPDIFFFRGDNRLFSGEEFHHLCERLDTDHVNSRDH